MKKKTEPTKKRLVVKKDRLRTLTQKELGAVQGACPVGLYDTKCCVPH